MLYAAIEGRATLEKRERLEVTVDTPGSETNTHSILNDVVINKSALARMLVDINVGRDEILGLTRGCTAAKLVDVVNIHDMTLGEHFERELAIVKMKLDGDGVTRAESLAQKFGAEVLDDDPSSYTLQLTGHISEVDEFVNEAADIGKLSAVARSDSRVDMQSRD